MPRVREAKGARMRKLLFAITAAFLSQTALADNILVTPADNGKTIALKVGQCLDVRLFTQAASTGYDWYLESGMSEWMSLAARTVTTPGGAPPGAPSQLDYILCAAAPGETTVKFLNKRIWEKNTPPAKTLSFTGKIAK
jgi:predicted secreted protein